MKNLYKLIKSNKIIKDNIPTLNCISFIWDTSSDNSKPKNFKIYLNIQKKTVYNTILVKHTNIFFMLNKNIVH